MNTKTHKKILFTKITMIISVILLAITIPIDICMGNYLHAFTTCLWIYISISTYKMANLLSDAIHVILRHNNHTNAFIEEAVKRLKNYLDNGLWVAKDVGEREKEVIIEDFINYLKHVM